MTALARNADKTIQAAHAVEMKPRPYPEPHKEVADKICLHRQLVTWLDRNRAVWYAYRIQDDDGAEYVLCFWCGNKLTRRTLSIEHVVPRARKGPHELWNLRPACPKCNQRRGRQWRIEEDEIYIPPLSRYFKRPVKACDMP